MVKVLDAKTYHQIKLTQILRSISTFVQLLFKTRKEAIILHYTFWLRVCKIFENRGDEFHSWFDDVAKTTGVVFVS